MLNKYRNHIIYSLFIIFSFKIFKSLMPFEERS